MKQLISDKEKHDRFVYTFQKYRLNGHIPDVKYFCLQEIEYHPNTMWTILAGKRQAPDVLIYKFCEHFKLDPAFFFGRSEELKTWGESLTKN